MNATSVLCWAIAWSMVGSGLLLVTACVVHRLPYASVRHFAWVIAFACVAVLPLLPVADWLVQKNRGTAQTQECFNAGANTTDGRPWFSAPARGFSSHPLSALALCSWFWGAAWTLGRAVFALRTVNRWRRRSVEYPLPAGLPLNTFRNVALRVAREAIPVVPITSGFRRPTVLLPRSAEFWDRARITAVLWHELGHICRGDNLSQLFALFICALHWFNPLFWFAARRMEAEAEMAADDFAILRGVRPSSYATELLAVASELRSGAWKFPMAHTAMVKAFTLEDRLRSIIDPQARRGAAPRGAYGKVAGVFAGMGVLLVVLTPPLGSWLESRTQATAPTCVAAAEANL